MKEITKMICILAYNIILADDNKDDSIIISIMNKDIQTCFYDINVPINLSVSLMDDVALVWNQVWISINTYNK